MKEWASWWYCSRTWAMLIKRVFEADPPETQRDAGRSAPPPDWADHLRAYTRGVAGEEQKK